MRIFHGSRFFFKLFVICIIAVFLTLYPGQFSVEWFGYKTTMPVALLLAIIFMLMSFLILVHHCWRWFQDIPNRTKGFFQKRRLKNLKTS